MAPQREWFEKDYYKILGVSATATAKEITSAYRSWPSRTTPTPTRAPRRRFKEISAAYDVLGDADQRKEYDEVRAMGPVAGGFAGGSGGFGGAAAPPSGSTTSATSATSSAACSAAAGRGGGGHRPGPSAAPTSRPSCTSSFVDAVHGVTTTVNVTTDVPLPHLRRIGRGAGHPAR